jgi:hypothetical protein
MFIAIGSRLVLIYLEFYFCEKQLQVSSVMFRYTFAFCLFALYASLKVVKPYFIFFGYIVKPYIAVQDLSLKTNYLRVGVDE